MLFFALVLSGFVVGIFVCHSLKDLLIAVLATNHLVERIASSRSL